jgi:hypothetical protein
MEKTSTRNVAVAQATIRGGASGAGAASPIVKVRRDSGFYDAIPWDKIDYWKQDGYYASPAPNVGPYNIFNFIVPNNEVLLLTSVVFRLAVRLAAGPPPQYAYMHDGAALGVCVFEVKVGGTSIQLNSEGLWAINRFQDIYQQLNQDTMIPQLPYIIAILPNQNLRADMTFSSAPAAASFYTGFFTVEMRGIRMAKGLFDKLAKEFAG